MNAARGWKTLIVNSTAKGDVLLRYNGAGYPSNPSREPSASATQLAASRLVLALDTAGATTRPRAPVIRTVNYVCDDMTELTIEFTPDDKFAKVKHGSSTWKLPHLDTGSGAARWCRG